MSLSIKFGDDSFDGTSTASSGFIYIDAVTNYTREFKGQVTSHPIGSGGNISDHFIRNNAIYNITGVISGADISLGKEFITGESGNRPINVNPEDIPSVKIKGNNSNLLSLLPDSISSYFVDPTSSVQTASSNTRRDVLVQIRNLLESLFEKDGLSLITLYEYSNNRKTTNGIIDPLVMTSLSFNEDPDSGLALYITMTLEHVTFAKIDNVQIDKKKISKLKPENVAEPIKKQSAPLTNKGFNPNATPLMSDEQKARIAAQSSSINKNKSILFTAGGFGR